MRHLVGIAGFAIVAVATMHCSGLSNAGDCTDYDTCKGLGAEAGPGDSGDGGRESAVIPPTCDLAKGIKDSPDCVDDGVGIFVSPSGKDGATGTRADPLRTISQGITAATGSGRPRVYVCDGAFDAPVTIAQAISLHGGLTCAWTIKADARPKLSPPKGVALSITKVSGAVTVEDFEVIGSSDANTKGDSSIAVFVSESKNVTFRRTSITAGDGQPGAKGKTGSNYAGLTAMAGIDANAGNGGGERTCACLDAKTSSKGGRGGTANSAVAPTSGAATPSIANINEGATSTASCVPGDVGLNGTPAAKGTAAGKPGELASTGWTSTTVGTAGGVGNPGQGGGGGGAINSSSQGGAGGGCGGCGGGGGEAGGNGGASFALLSFESTVSLFDSSLVTGAGGKGGDGGDGQDGQAGGGSGVAVACTGGTGGIGAGGSGGGGGAGGHSIAVAYRGTAPRLETTTTTTGSGGPLGGGGAGGQGGGNAGAVGDPGVAGAKEASLALQ